MSAANENKKSISIYDGTGADAERCFIGFQDENQSSYSTVENPTIFSRTNYTDINYKDH